MTNAPPSNHVLLEILRVLQRIEEKLESHEGRVESLEEHAKGTIETCLASEYTGSSIPSATETSLRNIDSSCPSKKGTPTHDSPREDAKSANIGYSQWGTNQLDRFFNLSLSKSLRTRLGDCWGMPDDNRLPLKFFKTNVLQTNVPWGPPIDSFPTTRQPVENELEFLCHFDSALRVQRGNDFVVVDFDTLDNTRLYRLGDDAVGSELEVEAQGTKTAPWSRLILYQGATTGDSIQIARKLQQKPIPYFTSTDKIMGLWDHLDYHLQTKRRGTTTNPYSIPWNGFHTDFYEVREVTDWTVGELWKHGPLYGHPLGWHFRKCSYTIYTPVSVDYAEFSRQEFRQANRYWTLLILAPDYFFDGTNSSFPMSASSPSRTQAPGFTLGKLNEPSAELHLIGQGLERITQRWAGFLSYFDYILDGSDSLMKPAEHDNLLFDDGAFSRSRKYFWAIDCLSEFELSITDNIVQWELYKAARVPSVKDLVEIDSRQFAFAERQYRVLQNQRESFRQKLASTKALRDAVCSFDR